MYNILMEKFTRIIYFILNFPWTLLGFLVGIISFPKKIRFQKKQYVFIVNVKCLWLSEIVMRRAVEGLTLGNCILLSDKACPFTYEHELVHIRQFKKNPFVFPLFYVIDSAKRGYRKNVYEDEAYRLVEKSDHELHKKDRSTKNIVKEGYNKAAEDYALQRDKFHSIPYLEKLAELLPANSSILDVGCGAGLPIDRFFVEKGYNVYGIDISERMIELAKKNVPAGNFEVKNMMSLERGEYHIDAIVSFYAIFHTPRETHQELFKTFNSFLPDKGLMLVTMGSSEWEGEENFHGAQMYWSQYGPKENKEIIEQTGFKILSDEINESGGEKHQVILARKIICAL